MEEIQELIRHFLTFTGRNPDYILVGGNIYLRYLAGSPQLGRKVESGNTAFSVFGVPIIITESDILEAVSLNIDTQRTYLHKRGLVGI